MYYQGVPLQKAIFLRYTPANHRAKKDTPQGAIGGKVNISDAFDYISRTGRFEDKSDIDRSITTDDLKLAQDYAERERIGLSLDYISRTGSFAEKGAEHQVDASLWGQYGPVDKQAAIQECLNDGGVILDAFISVGRPWAKQLGLTTKQDFQRLVRSTWTDSVMEWGEIKNRADVRWVAAYHTDADQSIHVHIYTWSANKDELKEGYQVGKKQTRRAKEIIYKHGYANIREQRNTRSSFLRDLCVLEEQRQLGIKIPKEKERCINDRAKHNGFPERLSKDCSLSKEAQEKIEKLTEKLELELKEGYGRLSNNYTAQATAKDILHTLENDCPEFKKLCDEHQKCVEVKADLKGYSEKFDKHDRKEFLQSEKQDFEHRMTNQIIKECVTKAQTQQPEHTLKKDLEHLDARNSREATNVSFSEKLIIKQNQEIPEEQRNKPMTENQQKAVKRLVEKDVVPRQEIEALNKEKTFGCAHDILNKYQPETDMIKDKNSVFVKVPGTYGKNELRVAIPKENIGKINGGRGCLAKIEIDKHYDVYDKYGKKIGTVSGQRIENKFGKADMDRIARYNGRNSEKDRDDMGEKKRRARDRQKRDAETVARAQAAMSPSRLATVSDFAVKHGMSLENATRLDRANVKLAREIKTTKTNNYENFSNRCKTYTKDAVREVFNSKNLDATIKNEAKYIADREGLPKEAVEQELRNELKNEIKNMAFNEALEHKDDITTQTKEGQSRGSFEPVFSSFGSMAGSIAESLINAAGAAAASSGKRTRHRSQPQEHKSDRELEHMER